MVAKCYPLELAVGMYRCGSLININPSVQTERNVKDGIGKFETGFHLSSSLKKILRHIGSCDIKANNFMVLINMEPMTKL